MLTNQVLAYCSIVLRFTTNHSFWLKFTVLVLFLLLFAEHHMSILLLLLRSGTLLLLEQMVLLLLLMIEDHVVAARFGDLVDQVADRRVDLYQVRVLLLLNHA